MTTFHAYTDNNQSHPPPIPLCPLPSFFYPNRPFITPPLPSPTRPLLRLYALLRVHLTQQVPGGV